MMVPFLKMHGLGNDFAVFDARVSDVVLSPEQVRHLADRHRGIGCDQLVVMEPSNKADVFMRIYNQDGSESGACGNAARCVAQRIMQASGQPRASIETLGGILECEAWGGGVRVNMGKPRFHWQAIPLSHPMNNEHITLDDNFESDIFNDGFALSMGNPHVVFFVDRSPENVNLASAVTLERHAYFPQGVNISVAHIVNPNTINLRVWERGAGLTLACGTAACAALVAAASRGLTERAANVQLPGGALTIEWNDEDNVLMAGPATLSFHGEVML